jgi:hypothetical protein
MRGRPVRSPDRGRWLVPRPDRVRISRRTGTCDNQSGHTARGETVASAEQIKALLKSHAAGDDERFRAIALQIAAHSAKQGDTRLAQELRTLLDQARRLPAPAGLPRAVPIARPAGELAGLVTAAYPTTRLPDMVLSDPIRKSLHEVEGGRVPR